jgi:hypothetical protein
MTEARVGDRAILVRDGATIPVPVVITAVEDGRVAQVALGGSWLSFGPDQFSVDGMEPAEWADAVLLIDVQS